MVQNLPSDGNQVWIDGGALAAAACVAHAAAHRTRLLERRKHPPCIVQETAHSQAGERCLLCSLGPGNPPAVREAVMAAHTMPNAASQPATSHTHTEVRLVALPSSHRWYT